jgi:hypothetical protein
MRFLLIILLSLSFHARSAVTFDSLFKESTFIAGGRVIHQDISKTNNPIHPWECKFDFVIEHLGAGGQISPDSLRRYYPGDTLRGLTYQASSLSDTLPRLDYFVLPIKTGSLNRKTFVLTFPDPRKGIFTNERLLYEHCPMFLLVVQPGQLHTVYVCEKRGWHCFTIYDPSNRRLSFESQKQRSAHVTVSQFREYDETGKMTDRTRSRTIHHDGRTKAVVWRFRAYGEICLKRRVYVTARF